MKKPAEETRKVDDQQDEQRNAHKIIAATTQDLSTIQGEDDAAPEGGVGPVQHQEKLSLFGAALKNVAKKIVDEAASADDGGTGKAPLSKQVSFADQQQIATGGDVDAARNETAQPEQVCEDDYEEAKDGQESKDGHEEAHAEEEDKDKDLESELNSRTSKAAAIADKQGFSDAIAQADKLRSKNNATKSSGSHSDFTTAQPAFTNSGTVEIITDDEIQKQVNQMKKRKVPSRRQSSRRSQSHVESELSDRHKVKQIPVNPAKLLWQGQKHLQGEFDTMEVFNTLPSMYTEERWAELKAKRRCDLNIEHLFWLSRFNPQNQDGYHLQNKIDQKIDACRDRLLSIVNPLKNQVITLSSRMTEFDDSIGRFRNEVANIVKLREQMYDSVHQNEELKSEVYKHDKMIQEMNGKLNNTTLSLKRSVGDLEKKVQNLDTFVHKPSKVEEKIQTANEKVESRLSNRIDELLQQMHDLNNERISDKKLFEEWQSQQNEFYKLNFDSVKELRLTSDLQSRKFEVFERVMSEFQINIEALKTHALSTDLHFESSLPLQIASIAFDVGIGAIMKKQYPKFRKHFRNHLKVLEKNFQDCSDPFVEGYNSIYRKNFYELPEDYLNPAKFVTEIKTGRAGDKSKDQEEFAELSPRRTSQSPTNKRGNNIPLNGAKRQESSRLGQERSLNSLHNDANQRRKSAMSRASSMQGADSLVPKSISRQLLDTLSKWQPVSSKWTIRQLYERVAQSVTDFLKLPMLEMNGEEFYSLYMDANNRELGLYKPLIADQHLAANQANDATIMANHAGLAEAYAEHQSRQNKIKDAVGRTEQGIIAAAGNPSQYSPRARESKALSNMSSFERNNNSPNLVKNQMFEAEDVDATDSVRQLQQLQQIRLHTATMSPDTSPKHSQQSLPPQFARLSLSGIQDPRSQQQQSKLQKAEQLAIQAERRKMQEQLTQAIENVVNRVEIMDQTNALRLKKLQEFNESKKNELNQLKEALEAEKALNVKREQDKREEMKGLEEQIEKARLKTKTLVGELEESITEQIKIPQLQLLHTEYQRLKEQESDLVELMLRRKVESKTQPSGKTTKDEGRGNEVRRQLTTARMKLRIIQKKIKKYGPLGKIPMGACMRIYNEDSSSSSSSQQSEEEHDSDKSFSSFGDDEKFEQKQKELLEKRKQSILAAGLVYQPRFAKVVRDSSKSLSKYKLDEIKAVDSEEEASPTVKESKISTKQHDKDKLEIRKVLQFNDQKSNINISRLSSVGKIIEENSVSESDEYGESYRVEEELNRQVKQVGITVEDTSLSSSHVVKSESATKPILNLMPTQIATPELQQTRKSPSKQKSSDVLTSVVAQSFTKVLKERQSQERPVSARNKEKRPVSSRHATEKVKGPLLMENLNAKDSDTESQRRRNERMQRAITYNQKGQFVASRREHRIRRLRYKAHEVACQTDPVEIGEVQFGYSENSDEEQAMNMEEFRVDEGTDAPKFIILNVMPGRAEGTDPWAKRDEKQTRIKEIVNGIKSDNDRKGLSNAQTDIQEVMNKFAMMKGGTLSDDIIQLKQQNQLNKKTYTAYKEKQDMNFFKNMIEHHQQLKTEIILQQQPANVALQQPKAEFATEKLTQLGPPEPSMPTPDLSKQGTMHTKANLPSDDAQSAFNSTGKMIKRQKTRAVLSKQATKRMTIPKKQDEDTFSQLTDLKSQKSFRRRRATQRKEKSTNSIDSHEVSNKPPKLPQSTINSQSKLNSEPGHEDQIQEVDEEENVSPEFRAKNKQLNADQSSIRDSSFDASLSEDEESEEEEDYVTSTEFREYQEEAKKQIDELKKLCQKTITDNVRLFKKIDKVDWTIVNQAEDKLASVLGEFQLSVDGLLIAIEHDIKQWKRQRAEIETKFESMALQLKTQVEITGFLKDEFFANQGDNQSIQEHLVRFMQIQVGLSAADELDKQKISLVGQKEVIDELKHPETHDCNQIVNLDPDCKACQCKSTVERQYLLQNLKLACLMYNPSAVQIPAISKQFLPRTEVVNNQKLITEELVALSEKRKARIEETKNRINKFEEEIRSTKIPGQTKTESPTRYLQDTEEKTFKALNFLGLDAIQSQNAPRSTQPNLNIMITNNNTNVMMSPSQVDHTRYNTTTCQSPISPRMSDRMSEPGIQGTETSRTTLMRKPILQGKIDSRAVVGIKPNMATSVNALPRQSYVKLSHKSSANSTQSNYKPGDSHYNIQKTLQPKLIQSHGLNQSQISRRTQKPFDSDGGKPGEVWSGTGQFNKHLAVINQFTSQGRSNQRQRRNLATVPSPDGFGMNGDEHTAAKSHSKARRYNRLSQDQMVMMNSDSAELPEIHHTGALSKSLSSNQGKSINITMVIARSSQGEVSMAGAEQQQHRRTSRDIFSNRSASDRKRQLMPAQSSKTK